MSGHLTADELRYVNDRLDKDHLHACATEARRRWDDDAGAAFEVCYQPGDGTHYALLMVPIGLTLPLVGGPGGGTNGYPPTHGWGGLMREPRERLFVYWIQRDAGFQVERNEFIDPEWLEGRLAESPASAVALCLLMNLITAGNDVWINAKIEARRRGEG